MIGDKNQTGKKIDNDGWEMLFKIICFNCKRRQILSKIHQTLRLLQNILVKWLPLLSLLLVFNKNFYKCVCVFSAVIRLSQLH